MKSRKRKGQNGKPVVQRTCEDCGARFDAGPRSIAKYCATCRPEHRKPKRTKYPLTESVKQYLLARYDTRVRGRVAEIAAALKWPKWRVQRTALRLGLCRAWPPDRRAWTPEEEAFLREWSGRRSVNWIARNVRRGRASVMVKLKRLRLSRRVRVGYTIRDLGECFGADHHTIERWIAKGYLAVSVQPCQGGRSIRRASAEAVREFLAAHREEYRLDQVDQVWFLSLLFDADDHPQPEPPRKVCTCNRCKGQFIDPIHRWARICPACRKQPGAKPTPPPTPAQIADIAHSIRRARGELPESTVPLTS